jgi:hypothetical protein
MDKIIYLPPEKKITMNTEKKTKKRIITFHHTWKSNITPEDQLKLIETIHTSSTDGSSPEVVEPVVQKQIHQKIMGYKYQDIHNTIFNETEFIGFGQVVELLYLSKLTCYYCQNSVQILYDYVREPNQWTLERLDNKRGHNHNNVVVSCLRCNLRRRTMYHERYLYTKQIGKQEIIKLS